jgi:hypothetical protein
MIGDGASALAVPLVVFRLTGSPVATALAAAARTLGYLLAGFVAGPVVDRVSARTAMIVADLLRAEAFLALVLLVALSTPTAATIIAIAVAAAGAGVFFDTACAVLVQDLLHPDDLVAGNARLEMSNQVGLLAGPALVGALVGPLGLAGVLALDAGSYLVSVASLAFLRAPATPRRAVALDPRGVARDLWRGLRYIRRHRLVLTLVGLQAAVNFFIAAETLVVFFAQRTLRLSAIMTALVVSAGAAGGVLAALTAERAARGVRASAGIAAGTAVLAVALGALGGSDAAWQAALANAGIGAGSVFATVHIRALRQRVVPRELLARVTATARTLAVAANPAGAALAGIATAAASDNPRPAFVVAGACMCGCATLGYLFGLRRIAPDAAPDAGPDVGPGAAPDAGPGAAPGAAPDAGPGTSAPLGANRGRRRGSRPAAPREPGRVAPLRRRGQRTGSAEDLAPPTA